LPPIPFELQAAAQVTSLANPTTAAIGAAIPALTAAFSSEGSKCGRLQVKARQRGYANWLPDRRGWPLNFGGWSDCLGDGFPAVWQDDILFGLLRPGRIVVGFDGKMMTGVEILFIDEQDLRNRSQNGGVPTFFNRRIPVGEANSLRRIATWSDARDFAIAWREGARTDEEVAANINKKRRKREKREAGRIATREERERQRVINRAVRAGEVFRNEPEPEVEPVALGDIFSGIGSALVSAGGGLFDFGKGALPGLLEAGASAAVSSIFGRQAAPRASAPAQPRAARRPSGGARAPGRAAPSTPRGATPLGVEACSSTARAHPLQPSGVRGFVGPPGHAVMNTKGNLTSPLGRTVCR